MRFEESGRTTSPAHLSPVFIDIDSLAAVLRQVSATASTERGHSSSHARSAMRDSSERDALGLDFSEQGARLLIRDRDSKYGGPFDEVFRSAGIRIVKTPVRAPQANAIAERFVRTARAECLDWLLILNRRHINHVLGVYVDHYNQHRPHRALQLRPPQPDEPPPTPTTRETHRHDRLGGLIHEYHRAAA
jgi:putative transposase